MLMSRAKAIIAKLTIAAVLSLGFSGLTATPAAAYGNDAIYQVTFSLNCVNAASSCVQIFGLGGTWGWFALNGTPGATSGSVDVAQTFCAHGTFNGAFHFNGDSTWTTGTSGVPFLVDPHGTYLLVTGFDFPLPATSGHYSFTIDRGFFGQITVQRIPGR
jgi:hypothetical protein